MALCLSTEQKQPREKAKSVTKLLHQHTSAVLWRDHLEGTEGFSPWDMAIHSSVSLKSPNCVDVCAVGKDHRQEFSCHARPRESHQFGLNRESQSKTISTGLLYCSLSH